MQMTVLCLFTRLITSVIEEESQIIIDWFSFNCMKAKPDKFQAIAVGKRTHDKFPVFKLGDANIPCEEVVKLLGVNIDFNLCFDFHIKNIFKKAAQQLNILKELRKSKQIE